ncbi:MAG TPA: glycosyltransferase family 2 protein, partial [Gemmatimonadaceae bacterium]|nr:glycosyltransferase family 2 protein [Gemmatimonadaceae bacterium]
MLYICIPTFDEAPTIGVLLWKIRKVFQEYSREYEILVYNDASTDATAETLEPYRNVLPLTVLGGERRVGYAGALTALCRDASQRTRYARRDAVITLQGDFTDQPEHIPELVKRFEGGADVVVAESADAAESPKAVRRLRRFAPWALRWSVKTPGVKDPFGSLR